MKVKKIAIVGGGSAGWMTASILIKAFPNHEIVVIESPDVPRVGVGESTYDGIQRFIHFLGIEMKDFFKHTDASFKLAIKLSCFYNNDEAYDYIYPFGIPDMSGTRFGLDDWHVKKALYPETPITDYAESYFPASSLVKYNTMSDNRNGEFDSFVASRDSAYHFDAIKFAEWLKNNYSIPRGVKLITDNVIAINVTEAGIESLELESGDTVEADLYVDCTGFRALLIGEAMNTEFLSYHDKLPNNRAWATQMEYMDRDSELVSVTTSTAIQNGWVWNIPLWSRIGTGYVYSDEFISPEDALEEFKQYLVDRKGRSREQVDSMSYKDIRMRVGIHEKVWNKNVVAIGLAAGFIEPLESNGLFSVHEFLFQLVRTLDRGVVSQWDRDVFNHRVKVTFDGFVEFIQTHYALSIRSDTPYWQANLERSYNFDNYNHSTQSGDHLFRVQFAKTNSHRPFDTGASTWISVGYEYFILDRIAVTLGEMANGMDYKKELQGAFANLDNRRRRWNTAAKKAVPLVEYLEKNYYS